MVYQRRLVTRVRVYPFKSRICSWFISFLTLYSNLQHPHLSAAKLLNIHADELALLWGSIRKCHIVSGSVILPSKILLSLFNRHTSNIFFPPNDAEEGQRTKAVWNNELVKWRTVSTLFRDNFCDAWFHVQTAQKGARRQTRYLPHQTTQQPRLP